ncbi:MAG: hypothetical protein ACXABX_00310 [Candidatus Thorarchaeota archaeon]
MKLVTIISNGHQIEVENTWSAKEIVRYDGRVVSERRSFWGGSHFFQVQEYGHLVNYEVTFNPSFIERISIVIRRNGAIIFSSDRRIKPPKEVIPIASSSSSGMVSTIGLSNRIQIECPYCGHRNSTAEEFCEKCRASI